MSKPNSGNVSGFALLAMLGVGAGATPALAQGAAPAPQETTEAIVVTGSLIRGTPEDAALPVDVFTAADLERIGSPTLTDLIKSLGVSSGVDGETNQFTSNGLEGLGNVNLRGLGPSRTLVLLNGRRMVNAPYGIGESAQGFVDTNMIPAAAIGRVEVLKDGAAATYGSDAIAGVVNFITKKGVDGLEIGGSYSHVDGSDGDHTLDGSWGGTIGGAEVFFAVGYQHRSELNTRERDWAIRPFAENPEGGFSSISNPGSFIPLSALGAPAGAAIQDPGCTTVGGILFAGSCRFQFTPFDNLVEEENRAQFFGSFDLDISDKTSFHFDLLYGYTDVPEWKTSPSYPPQVLTAQFVPASHPGLQNMILQNPSLASLGAGAGALFIGRSFGYSGNPITGGGPQVGSRNYNALRMSGGFDGEFDNGVAWSVAGTFMEDIGERSTNDTYITRLNRALLGFGGPNCTGTVAGANGCQYYNPFSNSIQRGAFATANNPQYVSSLRNTPELVDWLTDPSYTKATTRLTTLDFVLSGESEVTLPGGNVAWAVGAQYRQDAYELELSDITNLNVFPCPNPGQLTCATPTGPFAFLAGTTPADLSRDVTSLFGELSLPLTDTLDAQLAVRYEDYGGATGSTLDPKIALKWQTTPNFALRASAQTTFRGPTLTQLTGRFTTLQFVAPTSAFKAVDTFGNPNLAPESAFTYNIGALLNVGNFKASIDYFSFDFEDPVVVEPFDLILTHVLATACTSALASRVTFSSGCSGANVQRVSTNITNGPNIKTSGFDASADYTFDNVFGGEFAVGASATYLSEYEVDPLTINGIRLVGTQDLVGFLNRGTGYRPLQELKGEFYANYNVGNHNFRVVGRYVDEYTDQRTTLSTVTTAGKIIDSQVTGDLHYVWNAPWGTTLNASVVNFTDEDPPFARLDLNYDPYTHNPLGRVFKIGVSHKFGG